VQPLHAGCFFRATRPFKCYYHEQSQTGVGGATVTASTAISILGLVAAVAAVPAAAEEAPRPVTPALDAISSSGRASAAPSSAVAAGQGALTDKSPQVSQDTVPTARAVITIGPQGVAAGETRYAVRSNFADTALVVSFSATPPRAARPSGALPSLLPAGGRLTGVFGWRADPIHGATRFHSGVDLAAPAGSPIRATQGGSVKSAGWSGNYGYMVTLDHGNGVETRYAHMSAINVEAGRSVNQGDIIGLVGSSGRSTGPHVHYEVRVDGRATNPMGR